MITMMSRKKLTDTLKELIEDIARDEEVVKTRNNMDSTINTLESHLFAVKTGLIGSEKLISLLRRYELNILQAVKLLRMAKENKLNLVSFIKKKVEEATIYLRKAHTLQLDIEIELQRLNKKSKFLE